MLTTLATIGLGATGLYALHRLALRLEDAGHLYYLRRKPGGGGGLGSFVALQRLIEPSVENVQVLREEHAPCEALPGGRGAGPSP